MKAKKIKLSSNDIEKLDECLEIFNIFGDEFRGVYDYKEQKYVKRTP